MIIHLIHGFPAMLVVARPLRPDHGGQVLAVVDANQTPRRILALARVLLPHDQRRELYRVMCASAVD